MRNAAARSAMRAADAAETQHPHGLAADAPPQRHRALWCSTSRRAHSCRQTGSAAPRPASGRWRGRRHSSVRTPGVFETGMRRSRAVARSTASVPTPKTPITSRFGSAVDQRTARAAIGLGGDRPDARSQLRAQVLRRRLVDMMGDGEPPRQFVVGGGWKRAEAQYVDGHAEITARRPASGSCAGTRPGRPARSDSCRRSPRKSKWSRSPDAPRDSWSARSPWSRRRG